ncbi:MAG: fibronectin type III domain-containing protein [Bacteroidia bacterium]
MPLSKKIFFIILVAFCQYKNLSAQNYPVHITTQLVAPFSGYLGDYANAGEEKLKLILLFTDFSKPSYQVKLKFSVTGQNINIQSKSYFFAGPFTMQPGVPIEISGSELHDLLNSQNLDFTGLSKTQYAQSKVLPEGFYTFCVTAYDYNNPVPIQVSNVSCAQGWMILSDPPFLNLPLCSSTVTPVNPQQLAFAFTQMNMGSPNSAANTEYVFELWEVRPQNGIPNNIVQTVPPIFSYTTNLTSVNYGITEPPLLVGMQYAWRVRAVDITGRDLFKNNGYSQVCTFTYGNVMDGANLNLNLHAQGVTQRQIKAWWDSLSVFTSYNLEFRKAGTVDQWFPVTTTSSRARIVDLEPNTTYEFHVRGVSYEYTSPNSDNVTATTLPPPNYQCGETPAPLNFSQFVPLTASGINSIWQVGQFEMRILELQNPVSPTGIYSGLGKIIMPYGIKVNCKFTNVLVNSDQVLVQGKVVALTDGVETWLSNGGMGTIQDGTSEPEVQVNSPLTPSSFSVDTANGTVSVGGNTYTYTPSGETFEDSNGNIWVVTADGQVIQVGTQGNGHGPLPESKNVINTTRGTVAFKPNAAQSYGFDEYKHAELEHYYLTVKNATDNTHPRVNWKSVMAQKYDVMDLDYQLTSGLKTDSVLFITGTGTIYKPQGTGTKRKLYIIGGKHSDVQELFAGYRYSKDSLVYIAKINVVSYKEEQNKVTLVPLGNVTVDKVQIQKQLNEIYKQSVATWQVDVAPAIVVGDTMWDKDGNGRLNAGSDVFSRYSDELKAINRYLRKQNYYSSREYYLVITDKQTDSLSAGLQGEMPRGRNIGYLFTSSPSATLIAHELGHGAFALEHSFDGNATLPKSATSCLMDYNNGTELYKGKYWDYVHNPTMVVGVFEDDDDGASKIHDVNTWLGRIKDACKTNTSLSVDKANSIFDIYKTYVNGIYYDYIIVQIKSNNAQTILPKGKIVKSVNEMIMMPSGNLSSSCLNVCGGIIKIQVPNNRPDILKAYLEGTTDGKNLLVFVNGYRPNAPSLVENPKPNDGVTTTDVNGYWRGIDAMFINRIGTRNVVYSDGHHSVSTSNHRSQTEFLKNLLQWKCAASISTSMALASYSNLLVSIPLTLACNQYYHNVANFKLHTTKNTDGFNTRRTSGLNAGNDLVAKINNGTIVFDKSKDTIDIVCHSMGYAYALGIIDAIKASPVKIKLGRFYCLAPENACSGGTDFSIFEEVWQYGSNEAPVSQGGDLIWEQDGVAPQCAIPDITNKSKFPNTKHDRVYIPQSVNPKAYLDCHYIDNYFWIFSEQKVGMKGYVKPR